MGGEHRDPATAPEHEQGPGSAWRELGRSLAPRATRAQLLAGLLTALLGFAIVVQVQQNRSSDLSGLRQDELVRILDEVTQRTEELDQQAADLRAQRTELMTGSDTERAAREAAAARAEEQGILAGRVPAEGTGVELVVREPDERIPAFVLLNILEELRNAGAEAIQIGDLRITASSYIADTADGVEIDGTELTAPYRWLAIGDPDTITPALEMPGGALAAVRNATGTADLSPSELVEVTAVREIDAPRFATPVPVPEGG
ncbi:DUF881 domain-containing protein [Actinotalea sp.]|uniref:DUF881 domain-containing protein n=1 Tax=Actinotalea sp. TaxID=1872145 RepID=UPI002D05670C|nr:DUF881 domain-containing protein [Actinotalea sp.]HQY33954.1 DUF881 domain-containing protein [Actinotalea sp.]HRA49902.1 DUF881 domain-containing protein [Actinotalea sp.]